MSRIEIDMEEFQSMKTKIKNLENALDTMSKDKTIKEAALDKIKTQYEELQDESLYNRVFKWKKILTPLKETLKTT